MKIVCHLLCFLVKFSLLPVLISCDGTDANNQSLFVFTKDYVSIVDARIEDKKGNYYGSHIICGGEYFGVRHKKGKSGTTIVPEVS